MRKLKTPKKSKLGLTIFFEVIFGIYFFVLLCEPLLFIPTGGRTYGYRIETSTFSTIQNSRSKGTYSRQQSLTSYIMDYTYTVNNKEYKSSHISNMVIYSDPGDTQGYKTVYYNRLVPSLSILCPVSFTYFIINNCLFFITTLVLLVKIVPTIKYFQKHKKK